MTLAQLEYFKVSAEYGSFSQTAQVFYTTQPTVSRQIQALEDELGYALFDRTTKPLALTDAGHVFYESLCPILKSVADMKKKAAMVASGNHGFINFSFQTGLIVENHFGKLLENIHLQMPGLQISYQKNDLSQIKESLLSRSTDIALVLHTSEMDSEYLECTDLVQLQSYILVAPGHPLYKKEALDINDLMGTRIYLAAPVSGYSIYHGTLGGFYIDREQIIEVENVPTAIVNAHFGNGITIVNNFMDISHDDFKLFPILDNSRNPYVSVLTCKDCKNSSVSAVRDLIIKGC